MLRRTVVVTALLIGLDVTPATAVERGAPGERLVYSAPTSKDCGYGDRDLVEADVDGADRQVVATCLDDVETPSPDGERIATTFMTLTTGPARVTQSQNLLFNEDDGCLSGSVFGDDLDWSSDGVHVVTAIQRSYGATFGLYVHDLRDRSNRQLVAGTNVRWPSWHPAGDTVVYTVEKSAGDHDIALVNVVDDTRFTLIGGATDDTRPAHGPDGRIAFLRGDRPFVTNEFGTDPRRVADISVRGSLSWTPDGTRLVVSLADGIATIDVDDGTVTRLTTGDHLSPSIFRRHSSTGADGYGLARADGSYVRFGAQCRDLSRNQAPERPYVAATATPDRTQAWYVTLEGRVEPTGSKPLLGDAPPGSGPIVGIAATPTGNGYWLVSSRGSIYSFGDAPFLGSLGNVRLNQPIVGMAVTPTGRGYWLVASDGGIFTFGDARFIGSTGAMRLNQPVVGMAPTTSGDGYWLLAGDGGIFTFGDARFFGSTGALRLNAPMFTMAPTTDGDGYWLFARDGGVFTFGAARFHGSTGDLRSTSPVIAAFNRGLTLSN